MRQEGIRRHIQPEKLDFCWTWLRTDLQKYASCSSGEYFFINMQFWCIFEPRGAEKRNCWIFIGFYMFFWERKGAFSGDKRGGTGPKKKVLKRNSFGAVGKIMVPSEGGKHIFKKLALCRMEIQQNLKAVWKNLENIMTMDEEMKDLSAKAAKASPKKENCKNNAHFSDVFCNQALPLGRVKIRKTVPRCLQ